MSAEGSTGGVVQIAGGSWQMADAADGQCRTSEHSRHGLFATFWGPSSKCNRSAKAKVLKYIDDSLTKNLQRERETDRIIKYSKHFRNFAFALWIHFGDGPQNLELHAFDFCSHD